MIGKRMSIVLEDIENTLWEYEAYAGLQPEYTIDGFRAACKIFMSALMDKVWDLQERDDIDIEDRVIMVAKLGTEIRQLVKTYTDIDTHELYNEYLKKSNG